MTKPREAPGAGQRRYYYCQYCELPMFPSWALTNHKKQCRGPVVRVTRTEFSEHLGRIVTKSDIERERLSKEGPTKMESQPEPTIDERLRALVKSTEAMAKGALGSGNRPVTQADLRAMEERLKAEFRQLRAEILAMLESQK